MEREEEDGEADNDVGVKVLVGGGGIATPDPVAKAELSGALCINEGGGGTANDLLEGGAGAWL